MSWPARETGNGGRSGLLSGPTTMRGVVPGCFQAQIHHPLGIVACRGCGWRARPSTRELECLHLNSRVFVQFKKLCSELEFFRISAVFQAHVNRGRPRPVHVCSGCGGRLPATCAGRVRGADTREPAGRRVGRAPRAPQATAESGIVARGTACHGRGCARVAGGRRATDTDPRAWQGSRVPQARIRARGRVRVCHRRKSACVAGSRLPRTRIRVRGKGLAARTTRRDGARADQTSATTHGFRARRRIRTFAPVPSDLHKVWKRQEKGNPRG